MSAWLSVLVPVVNFAGCLQCVCCRLQQKACALEADKTSLKRKGKERLHLFGVSLMRSQVLHQAAQAQNQPNAVADCLSVQCSDLNGTFWSQVLTRVLKHGSPALQLRGTDVMLSAIQHDPAPLRQFMRSQKDHELFHLLVRYFCIYQRQSC